MRRVAKALFHALASSTGLQSLAARYGLRQDGGFVRHFVSGATMDEAIAAARALQSRGIRATLDHLGETARSMADAATATRLLAAGVERIADAGIDRNISVSLIELGLAVDRATCVDNLRRLLDAAAARECFVRIGMTDSRYTQVTLDIFETMWQQGYRRIGPVVQASLPRSAADVERFNGLGAQVRLVKGAYSEPRRVAYRSRAQIDAVFVEIMRVLLRHGTVPAIATHDVALIDATRAYATERGIGADRFEFQLLFGVRRDLQQALTGDGYRVRVSVPYGRAWFPYVMRRLGDRPSDLTLMLRTLPNRR